MIHSMRYKILVNLLKFQLFKVNTKLTSNKKKNDNELNCSAMLAHDRDMCMIINNKLKYIKKYTNQPNNILKH